MEASLAEALFPGMVKRAAELGYLAGMIDGEGSISIFISTANNRLRLILTVYNTNLPCLRWIQERFGGRVRLVKRARMKWKNNYVWETGWQHAANVLREVLPFMIIKRSHAELFIQCAATMSRKNHCGRNRTVPKHITDVRVAIVEQLKSLNRRGSTDALDTERSDETHTQGVDAEV